VIAASSPAWPDPAHAEGKAASGSEASGRGGALSDLRVLDLSRVLSGPFATMTLADLGADVIKIEQPGTGDDTRHWGPPFQGDQAAYFLSVNRNKRSVALDLKTEAGLAAVRSLAAQADVVVENFRPGTAARLGLGYPYLSAVNPGVVYASISGYGQTGPDAQQPGYDAVAQARSGLMSVTGEADDHRSGSGSRPPT
jgi:crotonobetainyl-CoA:carnitine CoA-transferase CaiB-like acyl-CoA transferase